MRIGDTGMALVVRYNFIVPDDSGYSLEELSSLDIGELSHLIREGGKYSWPLQTFHYLKKIGMPVQLSYGLDPDCINLAHVNKLRDLARRWDCFAVSLQGDYPRYSLAHYHVVQNMAQAGTNAVFVPFWPQIGQIPRNRERSRVQKVAYQGRICFTDLDVERLNADLNPSGVQFVALDNWQDLSEIDVLVGIRHYGKKRYKRKPASKLINAWHAGIPFIAGMDSAYEDMGCPGRDFLQAVSHKDLVQSILELKHDQALYNRLASAGSERAKEYTPANIARMWAELLETRISPAYLAWIRKPRTVMVKFYIRSFFHVFSSSAKSLFRGAYRIRIVKRLRDRFYDPVG